jgi:hypothetical protein
MGGASATWKRGLSIPVIFTDTGAAAMEINEHAKVARTKWRNGKNLAVERIFKQAE